VSLGVAGGVFLKVPTQYESTGTIVLTAPTAGATTAIDPAKATGPGNPLLDFEGSLTITTQLLIQSLSAPTVAQQIATEGGVSTYQAGDGETGGPFVVIVADADSPTQAELTVSLALKYAQNELDARQKNLNAPPSTYIGTQSVVSPTNATTKISGKVRDAGVALVLGVVVSLGAAYGIESWSTSRRRKRDDDDVDGDELPADLEPEDDETMDESAAPTKKMRAAPPPRRMPSPQPVRTGGPRPTPHPVGERTVNVGAPVGREPYAQAPMHGPAKPRPIPAPVPTTNNGAKNANGANGANNNGANSSANSNVVNSNGNNNGSNGSNGSANGKASNGNGNGNRHDWPRTEFRSPDAPTG
jgi:hypothetical protein